MFRFLHAADLHIDSPLGGLAAYEGAPVGQIRTATRRAVENLVALALGEDRTPGLSEQREPVDFVLIAGDVYDGAWRDFSTGLFFADKLNRLREAGIPVVLLAGNHDADSVITRQLALPDNAVTLATDSPQSHRIDLPDHGVTVHGQGFATRAVKADLSANYPAPDAGRFNVGLLHTSATGSEQHEPYAPCKPSELAAKGYDYWALGHIHTPWDLHDPADPHAAPIVFPGNTQGRHARELGPRGCRLVTVQDDGRVSSEFRPLDVVRWDKVEVNVAELVAGGEDSPDDFLRAAAEGLEAAVGNAREDRDRLLAVRVEFVGTTPADATLRADPHGLEYDVKNVANRFGGVWVEKVKISTRAPEAGARDGDDGPLGVLAEVLAEARDDPEALAALAETALKDLRSSLRSNLSGREGPDLTDPERLKSLLADAGKLARDRLTAG
ncbi:exonuclease SbcCD subunit D [Alienimonas sp. DA493]|uniref:metallophosphoesterase family protein n=1 Tax=Alienimonas sp. DA493 TaxID=3373605 RepID=UPI003754C8CA